MQTLALRAPLTRLHSLRPKLLFFYSTSADDPPHRRRPESYHSSSVRRQHEEESRSVRVTVWWDFENCSIPNGVNVFRVAQRITSVLRSNGIKGPVTINAFGDVAQLSRATQEALTSTGVCLTHVPHSGKNSSDRFFMADLIYWVSHNPPPMHFFLISGDRDFANILHRLRMSNYNILLASSDCASSVLWSSATIMWPWNGLVRGEDVVVKHFNHPPDGFYGSWYGHYKGILDDPFENMDQTTISQPKESMEQIADTKPRPIPKALVNGISRILNFYPEGITLSELRAELMRNNLNMEKDFFGYKNFSHLLSSLTNILRFKPHPSGEGQPLVVSTRKKLVEPVEATPKPVMEKMVSNEDKERTSTKSIKQPSPATGPIISPSSKSKETDVATSAASISTRKDVTDRQPASIDADANLRETSSGIVATNTLSSQQKPDTAGEGLFRKFWRALTGNKAVQSSEECAVVLDSDKEASPKMEPSKQRGGSSRKAHSEDKKIHTKNGPSHSVVNSQSSNMNKSPSTDKLSRQPENCIDTPNIDSSYVNGVARWWKFLFHGSESPDDRSVSIDTSAKENDSGTPGKLVEGLAQASCRLEAHDIFSKSHFWNSLELFLHDSKGTDLILKSRTREELVHGLQNESPSFLKGLEENHLHYLVDLLVSEKKWVEEYSFQTFPFKLVMPARDSVPPNSQSPNGLSSLFTNGPSQSKPEKGHNFAKKKTRSREEILCDCHKLLVELLKENPDGFNMCTFKPAFIQKYGYILDHQMLGYPKLASLLNIMPGVRLESSFILPAGKFCLDSGGKKLAADETICQSPEVDRGETINLNSKGPSSGDESAWEELGPVTETGNKVSFSEASLSDEDFTDSEDDDVSRFTESESQHKTGEEESSALLQVLDSWYSSKESEKDQMKTADGLVDCSGNNAQNSSNQKASNFSKLKTKHHRTYSFVSDSVDEKEKLVDSILESLKKGGPSKVHS
ncbi:uncharacterized protein LOC120261257 [Dioscorea cayenensis subsp. rotundata]|uniref:Uncharacterized protein LOC120261257 n=1 Tax=Dioscorea cayennensis subsp. rotundata TaxID=55577 RepID=A0AB40BCG0_DIOCR|nr:uncharacterized protein LOC120261257 [Dioscorea cayenensis subsp. rotundata]